MMVYSVLKEVLKYDECGWSNARSRARGFLYEEKIAMINTPLELLDNVLIEIFQNYMAYNVELTYLFICNGLSIQNNLIEL
jgi:hypothetical protein